MSTNSLSLYSELGRYPLFIGRYLRMVKYFIKLHGVKQENCILRSIIYSQRKEIDVNRNHRSWAFNVRSILQNAGYADVWLFPESVNINSFIPLLRTRLRDMYITNWREGMGTCTSLYLYRYLKQTFEPSSYLSLDNSKYRNTIAKIRLSSHKLAIETGRHQNIVRDQRKCLCCDLNDIEDEYHFILICPLYNDIRTLYIPTYYSNRPNMFKFTNLLNIDKTSILNKLAIYCIKSFKLRDTHLSA